MPEKVSLKDLVEILDRRYPPALAESWDSVGLVVGDPDTVVERVAFLVDPTLARIAQALEWGPQLIVAHHPLFFRSVSSVAATTFKGAIVHRLIRSDCALYTAHTNADAARGGVADSLAEALGLRDLRPLVPSQEDPSVGIGRFGRLKNDVTLGEFAQAVAGVLPPTEHGVRISGSLEDRVETVALLPGAGDSEFNAARESGADVYLTADLRHHPALEAREQAIYSGGGRPFLVDVSHSASEWHWLRGAARHVMNATEGRVETWVIKDVDDPWNARIFHDRKEN